VGSEVTETVDEGPACAEDVVVRPAAPADVPLLRLLILELAEYEQLAHEFRATESLLRTWLFGPEAVAEALVAHYRDEPAGMAIFFRSFSTFLARPGLYLEDLFVRPHLRGHGVGKAMMTYLAGLARERGYARLEWSVLDWNGSAHSFYRSLGAAPLDEWTMWRLAGDALDEE
jgi:GNAT superfamily N-acetyltransferase